MAYFTRNICFYLYLDIFTYLSPNIEDNSSCMLVFSKHCVLVLLHEKIMIFFTYCAGCGSMLETCLISECDL